jgi:hypothetical protein
MNGISKYVESLDKGKDFSDIFTLVKRAVKETLAEARVGLMLVLADLPNQVGAFHEVGSNAIVLNRKLLNAVIKSGNSFREINSYIFSILLHEYLHSLGHLDEREVRELSFQVSKRTLGEKHPATEFVVKGFGEKRLERFLDSGKPDLPQIIPDLERTAQAYVQ